MNTYNPFTLEGKQILVTGASSGIGRSTAVEASKMGAVLIITGRNNERLTETLNSLDGEGHQKILFDLSDLSQLSSFADKLPKLDGIVHSAGLPQIIPFSFVSEENLTSLFQLNFFAPFLLTRHLVRKRKIAKGGSILFVSSIDGPITGHIGNSVYSATKGAISASIKSMAVELAAQKIRVNAVLPGQTETPLIRNAEISEAQLEADRARYPLKRYARPEEIAWGILYFLSDASSFTTGTGLVIDGGFTLI